MPVEETLPGSRMGLSYNPSRSLTSSSQYGPGAAAASSSSSSRRQQRPSPAAAKKPPGPLRWAVADCLSSAATATATIASFAPNSLHGNPSALASEASRSLRYGLLASLQHFSHRIFTDKLQILAVDSLMDYIADPSTTDMAYSVLVEHALAERDRSPAVVPKCVTLLKRYLLRYVPRLQILRQIDLFCVNLIAECESVTSQSPSQWSNPLHQTSGTPTVASNAFVPSSPASNFASASLVKSLNYVRSLVARHIPKLSFRPIQPEASTDSKQSLPSLSSLLSRSFSSQLSAEIVKGRETQKEDSVSSISRLSSLEKVNAGENNTYIFFDLLKWRWPGVMDHHTASFGRESNAVRSKDVQSHGFLKVGAAALLFGDVESKPKDQSSKYYAPQDLSDACLLQPSTATIAKDYASACSHLKAITASKRMKPGPHHIWTNVPTNTFHPRARPLFQYRHYSDQQPLKLSFAEIHEVITEVCSESSSPSLNQLSSSRVPKNNAQPATDVAVSVLIKLVIDMYVMDPGTAAPLTLYMLEGMLSSRRVGSRARAFDFIVNLAVHAHLLEPMLSEDQPLESLQESHLVNEEQPVTQEKMNAGSSVQQKMTSAVDAFETWLLVILFEILRLLVQTEEKEEIVWASSLSCLFYFVCDRGQILRKRLEGLDIRVLKTLLEISREHSWSETVHCKLICMLTNMFYQSSNGPADSVSEIPSFVSEKVDLLGGIGFICLEYSKANLREEKRNLFFVLFDYVVHQINETCLASGVSLYSHDEVQPIISILNLANAPEAFYIAVKNGVEGMGEILKRSVSAALLNSPKYERLNMLLDKIMRKLDATISLFTRLDNEFAYMIGITKTHKSFASISDGVGEADSTLEARLSWATLHVLLHSERASYRHNGYIWLVELLLSEISDDNNHNMWSTIKKFEHQIGLAGSQDSAYLELPLSICLMCGLLKSKNNFIRWGFLHVLEKLLVRCQLLLDESNLQDMNHEDVQSFGVESRFGKASAVVDIMSTALSLVVQINETDHINILKMCDMLFTQLCFRHHSASEVPFEDFRSLSHFFGRNHALETHLSSEALQTKNNQKDELFQKVNTHDDMDKPTLSCETSSLAALLLRGHAIAPMQLAARVPASLFYWPLIQLAGAATDDIALGVAVGSKGRGNLPGTTSDIRAALLLLLIGKCTADSEAFVEIEGKEFFRGLLDDTDSRVAYYSAAFLLKRMMTEEPETYQRMLQSLIIKAQQCNNEKLLENPYLQMRGILQLSNDLGAQI